MSTRSRQRRRSDESSPLEDDELTLRAADEVAERELGDRLHEDLYDDDITDEEIEAFLDEQEYEEELSKKKPGFWNLPTAAGVSMIGLGTLYTLQQMGLPLWSGLGEIMTVLPWLAGILIILLGFGLLSWSPDRRRKKKKRAERLRRQRAARQRRERERRSSSSRRTERRTEPRSSSRTAKTAKRRKKLTKSREKKVLGVAGGIGEFLGIDPTLVRIAFVLATIFAFPTGVALYFLLGFVLPNPEGDNDDKRPSKGPASKSGSSRRRGDDDEPFIRVIRD